MAKVSAKTSKRRWRSVVAGVLAYALVLQGFLFAAAIGPLDNASFPGFELCTHNGVAAASPDAPSPAPASDEHCPFCIAGAVYVNGAPPAAPQYDVVAFTNAWPLPQQRLIAFFVNESAWPRGPPAAA